MINGNKIDQQPWTEQTAIKVDRKTKLKAKSFKNKWSISRKNLIRNAFLCSLWTIMIEFEAIIFYNTANGSNNSI